MEFKKKCKKDLFTVLPNYQNVTKTLTSKRVEKERQGLLLPAFHEDIQHNLRVSINLPWGNVDDLDLLLTYECVTISGVSIQHEHIVAVYY